VSTKIDFVLFDAGGGHRSAATALKTVIEGQRRRWEIRLVNLQEILEPIDALRKLSGVRTQDGYNLMLEKGLTLGAAQMLRLMHAGIRSRHRSEVRLLQEFWRKSHPDMVVSLVSHFNRALCDAIRAVNPAAPFVTVLTDLADYPPHFWIERQDQHVICGTERAVQQALALGLPSERVVQTSGMILHPHFYAPVKADRAAERRRLGLEADLSTGLVLFGGHGSKAMLDIARRLQSVKRDLQLIFICGHNAKLAAKLRAMESRLPVLVEEFTNEIPYYMHLSDFFIGKPGPGSISEALVMNLPVIVACNARTLPQERYNADWIRQNNVGVVVPSFRRIAGAVEQLLEPCNFESYRASAAAIKIRAVFEIPEILQSILEEAPPSPSHCGS